MISNMYGSIHTHFEDSFDAVNDIHNAVLEFILQGAVKVAATGHGVFTEYEDIRDAIAEARAKSNEVKKILKDAGYDLSFEKLADGRIIPDINGSGAVNKNVSNEEIKNFVSKIGITDNITEENSKDILANPYLAASYIAMVDEFDVVPGIEAYFEDDRSHMILIAKDYEGYKSLSQIITQSSKDYDKVAIVTLDNLKENVKKGHLYCTSACIAGTYGKRLALNEYSIQEKAKAIEEKLKSSGYFEARTLLDEKQNLKNIKKPTKADYNTAIRVQKKENNDALLNDWNKRNSEYEIAQAQLAEKDKVYERAEKIVKANIRRANQFFSYQEDLANLELNKPNDISYLKNLYYSLEDIFGKENYFFELQNHGLKQEKIVYNRLIDFADDVENPNFIASNDIHICQTKGSTEEEKKAFEDALVRRNVAQFGRFSKYTKPSLDDAEYVIKSDEELQDVLYSMVDKTHKAPAEQIVSNSISNIHRVLETCDVVFPEKEEHYPKFCDDEDKMFDELVEKGIKEKFPNGVPKEYRDRLDTEKAVIKKMGYSGYHLIVQDYLRYGRLLGYLTEDEIEEAPLTISELEEYVDEKHPEGRLGLGIGPGRGSAGGSLCCYALGITDIDPLKYGLLFERFLNVERISMPDIDSDFRPDVRNKTYEFCMKKYGSDKVCKVLTKTYLAAKGTIRKAGTYLGSFHTYQDEDYIKDPDFGIDLPAEEAKKEKLQIKNKIEEVKQSYLATSSKICKMYDRLSQNPELSSKDIFEQIENSLENDKVAKEIITLAKKIDGMFTVYGKHAAGVIISKDPLKDIIPIMYDEKDDVYKTQCVPAQAEEKGLLKMDFLGLKNLGIITNIVRTKGKEDYSLQSAEKISEIFENKDIYKTILAPGLTQGIFQLESPGMRKMLKEFEPESFDDVVLLVAAYRPGPMDYIPEIIKAKWHKKDPQKYPAPKRSITLNNKALEEILSPTYGCPIYQEQIMEIFKAMAGYSLGEADVVRRYMSKKKVAKLEHERHAFIYGDQERGIEGCIKKHGISADEANTLFEQMMPFAKYGFNKSHAVLYAVVAMYTAYLKYAHTADFYRCSVDAEEKNKDIIPYIEEAKEFGITFLPPSIKESENKFTVSSDEKTIRYGFSAIKGIGSLDIASRDTNLIPFVKNNPNISLSDIKKLAKLGLFDSIYGFAGEQKVVNNEDIVRYIDNCEEALKSFISYKSSLTKMKEELLAIPQGSEERTSAETSLVSLQTKFNNICSVLNEKANALKEEIALAKDKPNKQDNLSSQIKNEEEFLEYSPSSLKLLEKFANFDQNKIQGLSFKNTLYGSKKGTVKLPVIVVNGGANNVGKTKKNEPFHEVELMDITGEKIKRRYKDEIVKPYGWLDVYVEENKWFVFDESKTNGFKKSYSSSPVKKNSSPFVGCEQVTEDMSYSIPSLKSTTIYSEQEEQEIER